MTGPLITTFDVPAWEMEESPIIRVHTEEEARQLVRDQIPYKPDFIKIWGMPLPTEESSENYDIIMAAIDEAKKNNLRVFAHATRLIGAKMAIKAGANVLVHGVSGWSDIEFSEMLRDSNVVLIPTLVVSRNYSRTFAQDFVPSKEDFEISNPFILGEIFDTEHLTEEERWSQAIQSYPRVKEALTRIDSNNMLNIELNLRYGNTIATGTDAGNIGTLHASSYYDEIAALQKAGLSNLEILRASTLNGAIAANQQSVLGSIEVGKLADLVLLDKNPLIDLENLKRIDLVLKSGKVHHVDSILIDTPEILAQRQLNGYNAGDIDAFMEPYSEDVEIYNFPDELRSKGKDKMLPGYQRMFENNPYLHCELLDRMVYGNTVIDKERITGIEGRDAFEALAIYKIENNKIAKVYFVR
jgi:imidazolonepropionase-like amidohydrolase